MWIYICADCRLYDHLLLVVWKIFLRRNNSAVHAVYHYSNHTMKLYANVVQHVHNPCTTRPHSFFKLSRLYLQHLNDGIIPYIVHGLQNSPLSSAFESNFSQKSSTEENTQGRFFQGIYLFRYVKSDHQIVNIPNTTVLNL